MGLLPLWKSWAEACEGTQHASDSFEVGRIAFLFAFLVDCIKNKEKNNMYSECNMLK